MVAIPPSPRGAAPPRGRRRRSGRWPGCHGGSSRAARPLASGSRRGARGVEGDVPVARAGGQQEEVDPAGSRSRRVVRRRVGRVGDPQVPGRTRAPAAGPRALAAPTISSRPNRRQEWGSSSSSTTTAAVGDDVLVHHHDHQAAEVELLLGRPAGQGRVRGPGLRPPGQPRRNGGPARAAADADQRGGAAPVVGVGEDLRETCTPARTSWARARPGKGAVAVASTQPARPVGQLVWSRHGAPGAEGPTGRSQTCLPRGVPRRLPAARRAGAGRRVKVSRSTLRLALARLAEEGPLGPRPSEAGSSRSSCSASRPACWSRSPRWPAPGLRARRVLSRRTRPATLAEATDLQIAPAAPVVELVRLRGMDESDHPRGRRAAGHRAWLVDVDLKDQSLYDRSSPAAGPPLGLHRAGHERRRAGAGCSTSPPAPRSWSPGHDLHVERTPV